MQNLSITERLEQLMNEERIYLRHDLRITDVARMVGTNRTYLSVYINRIMKMSFSDYVNGYRVRHALKVYEKHPNATVGRIAELSGFANEQSFRINYHKVVGKPFIK